MSFFNRITPKVEATQITDYNLSYIVYIQQETLR